MKVYRSVLRLAGALALSFLLLAPAAAQFPIPGGQRGNGIGLGDVISIIGARRGGNNIPIIGQGPNRGNDKLQTAVVLASILYQMNQNRQQPAYQDSPYYYPNVPNQPNYPTQPNYPNYPQPAVTNSPARPGGYQAITNSGRPIRLDPSILPLTINPGGQQYVGIVQHAVDTWNGAGLGQLFALTNGTADLTIDWSGRGVTQGARAETRMMRSASHVVPTELLVKTGGRSAEHLAGVVGHELGHVLGLDHSDARGDMMYRSEQDRPPVLSQRDHQMLHWLYSQQSYTPVVGLTDINGGSSVARNFRGTPAQGTIIVHSHEHDD